MSAHTCHAVACKARCPPERLMCWTHWQMVPHALKRAVWRHYRPGQCEDKQFSPAWHVAATRAINAVAVTEGVLTEEQAARRLARVEGLYRDHLPPPSGEPT